MDKIYSRPRIRFKNFKQMNKKQKLKFIIYMILVLLFIFLVLFIRASYPVFVATCENAANSVATNILNKEVNEVMVLYDYNDLVNLGKDENGNITYIEAKIIPINEIVAKITNNIRAKLDMNSTILVNINFGSVSRDKRLFWN